MTCDHCGGEFDAMKTGHSWMRTYTGPDSPIRRFCPACTKAISKALDGKKKSTSDEPQGSSEPPEPQRKQ